MSYYSNLKDNLLSIPGWDTKRKIIVIESDDWGSIRMSSRAAFDRLTQAGIDLSSGDSWRFNLYDTMAGANDFDALFSVLKRHKDQSYSHPRITAVSLVANPDFEKIRKDNFQVYHYEPITLTLKRYYPNEDVWACWKQGIADHIFVPQFHGREHLNVTAWMSALESKDRETGLAFEEGIWGFNNRTPLGISYQAAFDLQSSDDIKQHKEVLADGLRLFEKVFGYRASFFVPPNGFLHEGLYECTRANGIRYLYSSRKHLVPLGNGRYKTRFNYLGKKNNAGQRFITRNAFFEPTLKGRDWVRACLKEIETAFRWRKPAIISTHRVNFIGALDESNRTNNLKLLDQLLGKILRLWPEVEFMTSVQLGHLMDQSQRES